MINPSKQTDILPNVFIQNVDLYDYDDETEITYVSKNPIEIDKKNVKRIPEDK